jgi:hypothetical protein
MEGIGMTAQNAIATQRVWRIVRLHFINKWTTIGIPWLVMAFIFLVNLSIWAIIAATSSGQDRVKAENGLSYTGASFYIFVYLLIVALQAINNTFPFALGFGVTRREFSFGTAIAFALLAIGYGAALTLLSYIEQWTQGWGLGGHMFTAIYFSHGPWYARLFVFAGALMFFFFVGALAASVFVRWRGNGLLVLGAAIAVIVLGLVAVATFSSSWDAIGRWFLDAGSIGIVGCMLIAAVIAAVAGFFVLGRATPRTA